ncbi:MAG: hypothetical protein ABWX92_13615 [Mycetocola sp.]
MKRKIRNTIVTIGVAVGLVVATSAPATAGINFANHTEPLSRR